MIRYGCSIYFILLFVITKTNWRNSVTAILGINDVNSTTPYFSRIHLIQNDVLYRERKEERGKKKERALMKLGWRITRYIWHRDNRNVFIPKTLGRYNVTDEWHVARRIFHTYNLIRMLCLSAQYIIVIRRKAESRSSNPGKWQCPIWMSIENADQYLLISKTNVQLIF